MTDLLSPIAAAPAPDGVIPNFTHPKDVLHTTNTISGILTISLIAPFVLLRLYTRLFVARPFLVEDWFCLVAWLLATGYCLTGLFMGIHGGGNHQHEITNVTFRGFQQALYADTIVYGPTAWFTKTTLLLIFVRVFSPFKKTIVGIYIFIALMLGYYLPVMIIKINVCTPIRGLWDPNIQATCINQAALFMCDTIMSAVTDLAILILPIPLVWSLNTSLRKKIQIGFLLGAGGIATGASIIRLILVFQPNSFADETVSFVRFNLLGVAEIGIGLICATFPAFSILLMKISSSKSLKSKQTPPSSTEVRMEGLRSLRGTRRIPGDSLLKSQASYVQMGSSRDPFASQQFDQAGTRFNGDDGGFHACTCHVASSNPLDHRPTPWRDAYPEKSWRKGSDIEIGEIEVKGTIQPTQDA